MSYYLEHARHNIIYTKPHIQVTTSSILKDFIVSILNYSTHIDVKIDLFYINSL
jgi:hypothetical protein